MLFHKRNDIKWSVLEPMGSHCRKIARETGYLNALTVVCVSCIDRIRKGIWKGESEIESCRKLCKEYYELARLVEECAKIREEIEMTDILKKLEETFESLGVFEKIRRADEILKLIKQRRT